MLWDPVKGMWFMNQGGERRYMGRNQITHETRKKFGIGPAAITVRPESQWTEQDFRPFAPAVKDQNGEGACVAFSSTTVHQTSRAMQGMSYVDLSCGHLYGQINGGQDSGANVEQALVALTQTGQCTTALVGDLKWQPRGWPSGVSTEAARYKIELGGQATTFEEICSGLEDGKLFVIGIDVARNFNPTTAGVLPDQSGSGGGHALAVLGKTKKFGAWRLIIRNSWRTSFGDQGDCYMPRSYIDNAGGGHYHVIASRDDPNDTNNPPVAK